MDREVLREWMVSLTEDVEALIYAIDQQDHSQLNRIKNRFEQEDISKVWKRLLRRALAVVVDSPLPSASYILGEIKALDAVVHEIYDCAYTQDYLDDHYPEGDITPLVRKYLIQLNWFNDLTIMGTGATPGASPDKFGYYSPTELCEALDISADTLKRRLAEGIFKADKVHSKLYKVDQDHLNMHRKDRGPK